MPETTSETRSETIPDPLRENRDRLLEAVLPHAAFDGWGRQALQAGAADIGLSADEAESLFPGGGVDMVSHWSDLVDRQLLVRLRAQDLIRMPVRERIAAGVMTRLEILEPHREAARLAMRLLMAPRNGPRAARLTWNTADVIWYAAGDTSTDYNRYTKRGLLSAVYVPTVLYWLQDRSPDLAETRGFLERRIREVLVIPKVTGRLEKLKQAMPFPLQFAQGVFRRGRDTWRPGGSGSRW